MMRLTLKFFRKIMRRSSNDLFEIKGATAPRRKSFHPMGEGVSLGFNWTSVTYFGIQALTGDFRLTVTGIGYARNPHAS